jgi:ribonuclease HI
VNVKIYSDGSCLINPGQGGYAALIIYGENKFWVTGSKTDTTNNQMELLALISALEFLKDQNIESTSIDVYTDSKYVQLGISQWIYAWIKQNWISKGKKILNRDLWDRLLILKKNYPFNIHWVKGHSNDTLNNLVDNKARAMAKLHHQPM